ncbi:DNA processing protein DprA [Virgibacillus soli]|nr:DNA processing protein DprA [Virgibacillus soli]
MGNHSIRKLLQIDPSLTHLYTMSPSRLQQIFRLKDNKMKLFLKEFDAINPEKLTRLYQARNIKFITIEDLEYPPLLKEIHDPPLVLFLQGNLALMQGRLLAIVGARDSDHFGESSLRTVMPDLIREKLIIVSGLAKGADTMAHKQAIEFGGKTIGVIGGGLFHIYPHENRKLAELMAKEHLIISEYPPIRKPQKWHFPMRNRIIAGLTFGTLVIQAKKRSGSLITADMALESGREVYAFPGPINHRLSAGTNHLIQQGAKLIGSSEDILEELYFKN